MGGSLSFVLPLLFFILSFLWCALYPLGTGLGGGQRGASNGPPLRGLRTGNGLYMSPP